MFGATLRKLARDGAVVAARSGDPARPVAR
jgi:hypothetical protein